MNTEDQQQCDDLSGVTDLSDDALFQVTGGADHAFIDANLQSKVKQHGPVVGQSVKVETDHHGLLWRKKAEEQKTTLRYADGHKEKLYNRREIG